MFTYLSVEASLYILFFRQPLFFICHILTTFSWSHCGRSYHGKGMVMDILGLLDTHTYPVQPSRQMSSKQLYLTPVTKIASKVDRS